MAQSLHFSESNAPSLGAEPVAMRHGQHPLTRRQAFLRYYAMRASSAYSSGAHDEWNIFVRINLWRPLGEQVAVFFDGRPASPGDMESEVAPGYELR
jgi:hypothetical protein